MKCSIEGLSVCEMMVSCLEQMKWAWTSYSRADFNLIKRLWLYFWLIRLSSYTFDVAVLWLSRLSSNKVGTAVLSLSRLSSNKVGTAVLSLSRLSSNKVGMASCG